MVRLRLVAQLLCAALPLMLLQTSRSIAITQSRVCEQEPCSCSEMTAAQGRSILSTSWYDLDIQVASQPYTPQIQQKCHNPQNEHYVETINKCCRLCPPGYRVHRGCNESIDTHCVPCEEGMYTSAWSRAERCFSCTPQCKADFVELRECTPRQNRFCWCQPNQFCQLKLSETCLRCVKYRSCGKGYGVVKPGTDNSDVLCAPCDPGTFSDVDSSTAPCKPHKSCRSVLVPGNSTNDAICSDLSGPVDIITHVPHNPVTTTRNAKSPPSFSVTRDPTLGSKQKPPTDISSVAGWVAGVMFVVLAVIIVTHLSVTFHNKDQDCARPCGKEKQPFSLIEKGPGTWVQDARALGQEEENLLQISASSSSGSLGSSPGSDKSSGVGNVSTLKMETERPQQRSPLPNGCPHHRGANPEQAENRGTHVNVSCVVSVCRSDHSLKCQSLNGSDASDPRSCTLVEDDIPLSKEESPGEKEPGKQIAVEVEDSMDIFDYSEGKSPPLSVQDVGMKTP